jgi:hypothetical protein
LLSDGKIENRRNGTDPPLSRNRTFADTTRLRANLSSQEAWIVLLMVAEVLFRRPVLVPDAPIGPQFRSAAHPQAFALTAG